MLLPNFVQCTSADELDRHAQNKDYCLQETNNRDYFDLRPYWKLVKNDEVRSVLESLECVVRLYQWDYHRLHVYFDPAVITKEAAMQRVAEVLNQWGTEKQKA